MTPDEFRDHYERQPDHTVETETDPDGTTALVAYDEDGVLVDWRPLADDGEERAS